MMPAQQSQVPPELGALLTLVQGMQQGRVSPSTPDGQPTIAAQAMQAAQQQAQPGMQQAAQNAGIGAQQQMQQQQAAMQQLPQQVQQLQQRQQAMEQGISRAPGAGTVRMAAGGIVGGEEDSEEARDRKAILAALKAMGYGAQDFAAMGMDIMTMPTRMMASVHNALARGGRAFGAPIPKVPEKMTMNRWMPFLGDSREGRDAAQGADVPPVAGRERGQAGYPQEAAPSAAGHGRGFVNPPLAAPGGNGGNRGAAVSSAGIASAVPVRPQLGAAPDPNAMFESGMAELGKLNFQPPSQGDITGNATARRAGREAWMQQTGNDPQQQAKDIAASEARAAERAAHVSKLEGELAGRSKNAGLIDFLINARGNKGEGIGRTLATGAAAAQAGDKERRAEGRTITELKFAYQEAAAKEQAALRAAKLATDMGDFAGAEAALKEARDAKNAMAKINAEAKLGRAKDLQGSADVRTRAEVDMRGQDIQAQLEREKMKSSERVANIAAGAARGANTPAGVFKEVQKVISDEFELWVKNPMNLTATPVQKRAAYEEIYNRVLREAGSFGLNVPKPTTAAAPAAGTGGFKVLSSRPAS